MEKEPAALVASNFYLPASDKFVAARADPPVVERSPFPPRVGRLQDFEPILEGKRLLHTPPNSASLLSQSGAGMNCASRKSRLIGEH
jgi:hypothetical protein